MKDFDRYEQWQLVTDGAECRPLANGERPFLNRELSWMAFNERVLEEARDGENPLLERLNFLAITESNLAEFFMIRVASLCDLIAAGVKKEDAAGLTPKRQLEALLEEIKAFIKRQYVCYNRQILPALNREGIEIKAFDELDELQKLHCQQYFMSTIFPVLTPLAVDAGRPFPFLASKSLNFYVSLHIKGEKHGDKAFAIVPIPSILPRILAIPDSGSGESHCYILLESLIRAFMYELFDQHELEEAVCFRVMRNADFEVDEDESNDLMEEIEDKLYERQRGDVIRLDIEQTASKKMQANLSEILNIPVHQIFKIRGPLDLTFLFKFRKDLSGHSEWLYPPYRPQPSPAFTNLAEDETVFDLIRRQDVILHHPYESFDSVIDVIREAAADPRVLAIKQTLYRVSGHSPIVASLEAAARAGKQVMVLVELKARFDEENNIRWARELERAGCHVIYGLKGLKTHSKITLIVREDDDAIRRYVHLGTGNYNDSTAKIYTDFGLWTSSEAIGVDATEFFNMISGYSLRDRWRGLIPAPRHLRKAFVTMIRREADLARQGRKALIVVKVNALVDTEMIEELYKASMAGVHIRLIVRGICCLKPGIKGLSENIEVRSLVGRFLEHSRIFYFYNDGREDLFLGSADWMPRNLDRRIELIFPVRDDACRARVFEVLDLELRDTLRARLMASDGTYDRVDLRGREQLDSQLALCAAALKATAADQPELTKVDHFEPVHAGNL